ncbi:unnamed protein product, partial [Prunus brigantina]
SLSLSIALCKFRFSKLSEKRKRFAFYSSRFLRSVAAVHLSNSVSFKMFAPIFFPTS